MTFTEWWDLHAGKSLKADGTYRWIDVSRWAASAYNDGVKEGLRRTQVASKAPSQGGGSQTPAPVARGAVMNVSHGYKYTHLATRTELENEIDRLKSLLLEQETGTPAPDDSRVTIRHLNEGEVSRHVAVSVRAMDKTIVDAINNAKNNEVPQGLIVGLLHGYAHAQTAEMMGEGDG